MRGDFVWGGSDFFFHQNKFPLNYGEEWKQRHYDAVHKGRWNGDCKEAPRALSCIKQSVITVSPRKIPAVSELFFPFLSLKVCKSHGRKTQMETQSTAVAKPLRSLWSQEACCQPAWGGLSGFLSLYFLQAAQHIKPGRYVSRVFLSCNELKLLNIVQHLEKSI